MGGTAVAVDVQSVRLVIDDVCVSAEGIKYALRNGGSTSVGAVEADLFALKRSCRDGNQVLLLHYFQEDPELPALYQKRLPEYL